jgi:DNA-directed RNA polymerase specialized sigma24 family protein
MSAITPSGPQHLSSISTRVSSLQDSAKFVMRYGKALRNYIGALVRDAHDADDVTQTLMLHVVRKGFVRKSPQRGRFRDYLKAMARNVAMTHRQRKAGPTRAGVDLDTLPTGKEPLAAANKQWLLDWRACLLDKAWLDLESYQRSHPGNRSYAVLRLAVAHRQEGSAQLAERLGQIMGCPMRADAFRKQLSRARRLFAEFVWAEVGQTLREPTPRHIEEELLDLGLLSFVRRYLGVARTKSPA